MRAALVVALWVAVSVPLAFAVGALLRAPRTAELAEQVDAYLRRLASGRGVATARRTTRIVLVCAGLVVLAVGSLRLVSDVPQRIITAGIRNADFFGPGPGGPSSSVQPNRREPAAAAPPTVPTMTDEFGEPITADDLGIPVPSASGAPLSPTAAPASPEGQADDGDSDPQDAPSRQPAVVAEEGDGEPVSEPAEADEDDETDGGSFAIGGSPTTTTSTSTTTTTAPPATTTATTSTTTTTTTAPPPTTTTTTSTTSTTAPPEETTTTTSTTAPPEPDGDDAGNGNRMGSIDHEPASYGTGGDGEGARRSTADGSTDHEPASYGTGGDREGARKSTADGSTDAESTAPGSGDATDDGSTAFEGPAATEPEPAVEPEPADDATGGG